MMQQVSRLLQEARAWPTPERSALAALAEAAYGHVGWGKSAKKKARKAAIAALRDGSDKA
jgi:hypothetical protein